MPATKREIIIIKFLQETLRGSRSRIGFLTLEQAKECCKETNTIVSHSYRKDGKRYMWFSDDHTYGYKDDKNKLKGCVPSSSYLPTTVAARPGLESGIINNLDDWLVVHFYPTTHDVLINDFDEFVRFIDKNNLYTGD